MEVWIIYDKQGRQRHAALADNDVDAFYSWYMHYPYTDSAELEFNEWLDDVQSDGFKAKELREQLAMLEGNAQALLTERHKNIQQAKRIDELEAVRDKASQLVAYIDRKFKSGNDCPVTRITITADEWEDMVLTGKALQPADRD